MTTFFIGWCVREFPNIYRAYVNSNAFQLKTKIDALNADVHSGNRLGDERLDPALLATQFSEVADAFNVMNPQAREIFVLRAQGYGNEAIAELMNTTVGAIESRIHRARRRLTP